MPKRKSAQLDDAEDAPPRRSTRQRTSKSAASSNSTPKPKATKAKAKAKSQPAKGAPKNDVPAPPETKGAVGGRAKQRPVKSQGERTEPDLNGTLSTGRQYWLMKAEPETRYENGVDVSFSIDDLAAKTEPEPWDGIRNYTARNNLRSMKIGDLAFFSHSNCKEPGIVGTMEIVKEHTPDLSAHDPKSAYYDPKSSPSDPKWSVVHVVFRTKFAEPIKLKEMREMATPGKPLENMQMMKQSRLSVSRVSEAEWEHLMGVAEEKAKAAA